MSDYVNVSEFARRAGVSRQTVYNKIKDGTLHFEQVGSKKLLNVKYVNLLFDTFDDDDQAFLDGFDSGFTPSKKSLDTSEDSFDSDSDDFLDGFDGTVYTSDTLQVDTSETFDNSKSNLDKAQMTFQEVFGEEFRQGKDSESSDICQKSDKEDPDSVTVALLRDAISALQAQTEAQKAQLDFLQEQHRTLEAQLAMKDAQINDLSQRLQEAHTIADHSQHLYAAAELRLKAITDQSTQEHTDTAEDGQKHWWQFWK